MTKFQDEKDRHKSSSSSHKTSSSSRSEKDKDRDRDRKERRDRERDKVRSDRDRDKDRSSSRRDKDTTGEKRKDVDDKEDKAQKKLRTAAEDSDQASGFNQQASVDAEDLSDVVPPRPPTPPEIRKPKMERPKTVKEFGSKLRLASFLEDDNGPPLKKKITKSLATSSSVLNKPSVPSVSRMRNLSGPSGVRASLMSAHMNQTEQQVGNIKLIAPKASHLIMENEGFMNALNASNHAEKPGLIKKKKKVGGDKKAMDGARRENSRDESGEEGAGPDGEGNKDISSTDDVRTEFNDEVKSESSESEPVQAAKEESGVAPISEPPKLSFYKDTLEETTDEESKPLRRSLRNRTRKTIIEQDSDEEEGHEKDKLASENTKVERMEDEASQESTSSNSQEATSSVDNAASAKVDETVETEEEGIPVILQTLPEPSSNTSGVKSILTIVTNKNKVKKSVRWKEEGELKAFYYFENDPNERINVNNANHMAMQQGQIGQMGMDIKMIEMRMERERLRAPNDRMEEQQTWRMPPIIDIPPERAPSLQSEEIGRASEMRHVEAARQATVLEVIYFSRHMVPDSAVEPEPENRRPSDAVEVKVIPLEDVEAVPEENTWTEQTPSGVATELPPALTNLFANIANQSGEAPGLSLPKMPPEIPIIPQGPPEHFPMGPAPPMPPLGGHPDMSMPGPLGPPFMPPNGGPQGPLPMVPIIPDQESGGHWGPMQPQIRGPPRTLCKFFKQGHCRFGGGCSFLHPGVNGPDIR
ncbi:hypothetical protein BIW11_02678 [Tropilaelaps mercedesae]|uniref:C3H1-type domain-containing protein n=1 Tax=Tropilaelaps mercedesae TaxID=418985 RepID=A0A1V9XZ66_9ACAR|nr:hypothetical protein BIW11_02678 [Tropilaelaps mercedesae]